MPVMNEIIERLLPKTEREAKTTLVWFVVAVVLFVAIVRICA